MTLLLFILCSAAPGRALPRPSVELTRALREMALDFRRGRSFSARWLARISQNPELLTTPFTERGSDDVFVFRFLQSCATTESSVLRFQCRLRFKEWSESGFITGTETHPLTGVRLVDAVLIRLSDAFEDTFLNQEITRDLNLAVLALEHGHRGVAERILDHFFDPRALAQHLLNQCFARSREPWNHLLRSGYHFSSEDLHRAVDCDSSIVPLSFVLQGVDLEIDAYHDGMSALHRAALSCNGRAIRALLVEGASTTCTSGTPPLNAEGLISQSADVQSEACQYSLRLLREGPDAASPPSRTEFIVDEDGNIRGFRTRTTRIVPASP